MTFCNSPTWAPFLAAAAWILSTAGCGEEAPSAPASAASQVTSCSTAGAKKCGASGASSAVMVCGAQGWAVQQTCGADAPCAVVDAGPVCLGASEPCDSLTESERCQGARSRQVCTKSAWMPLAGCVAGETCSQEPVPGGLGGWRSVCLAPPLSCLGQDGKPDTSLGAVVSLSFPASPADDPRSPNAVLMLTLEGEGIADGKYRQIKPYSQGMDASLLCQGGACASLPYAKPLRVRAELWGGSSASAETLLGLGYTAVFQRTCGAAPAALSALVTRANRFTPLGPSLGSEGAPGGAGSAAVALAPKGGEVLVIGGARPASGSQLDPQDPDGYGGFSDAIARYNPATAQFSVLAGPGYRLSQPRAFHAAAVGKDGVAVAGGYVVGAAGAKLSNTVEFVGLDGQVTPGAPLVFARAGATIVALFANSNYFLILGGKGDTPCFEPSPTKASCTGDSDCSAGDTCVAKLCSRQINCAGNTWELWHPTEGNKAQGRLTAPRWNHAAVRLPALKGGYVMLIGGESEAGVRSDIEFVQFTSLGGGLVSRADAKCDPNAEGLGDCLNSKFMWQPLTQSLDGPRTLPSAAQVPSAVGSSDPAFHYVAIVGGYADAAHTKPLASLAVFDVAAGGLLAAAIPLQEPRGAPAVAAIQVGPDAGQLLIAGGQNSPTAAIASAEVLRVTFAKGSAVPTLKTVAAAHELPDGGRSWGTVTPLTSGHVLLAAGVGQGSGGWTSRDALLLWTPLR